MDRVVNVEINGQYVRKDSKNAGVMGESNVTTLHITMDDTWRGFGKRIVWRDTNGENPVSVILFETDSAIADPLIYEVTIPAEPMALPGWCSFTIEGYSEVDGVHKVAMSVSDHLYVEQSDSYYKPAEPTPSQTQQVFEALGKTEKKVHASAIESRSWAVGGTGTRPGEDTDNSKYYAKSAEESAEIANDSKTLAEASAKEAERSAHSVSHMAHLAESWAVGGTGTRPGEDTDNAKYWSALAQVAASGENTLYVDAFGAVGDGVTDDTGAIQAAIDFAGENNLRILSFRHGRSYKLTKQLKITKPVSLYGNGAKIISYIDSGFILYVLGSIGDEINLAENVAVGSEYEAFVNITTATPHGFSVGDRIIIQSQRDALAEESGDFWCGTITQNTYTCQYAEVLTVNKVEDDTAIQCTGTLIYPYYYANREAGVDVSQTQIQREHSTVRKANFLRDFQMRDFTIECYGAAPNNGDNTLAFQFCENPLISNVRIIKHQGHGRGMVFINCLNGMYDRCVIDATDCTWEDSYDTHVFDNHFTFVSSWFCAAQNCASYHAGQTFDATYSAPTGTVKYVRCPTLFPAVRGCLTHGAADNAATNHSGSFGCTYENCRFTNFARPLMVRSPNTLISGCTFSARAVDGQIGIPNNAAIQITEPTIFGTRIENCVISSSKGINIKPVVNRLDSPPSRKKAGISIEGNVFFCCRDYAVEFETDYAAWDYQGGVSSGAYTDYAKDLLVAFVRNNTFIRCGTDEVLAVVYAEQLANGVSVENNSFIECKSKGAIISFNRTNTDMSIVGNRFYGCQAKVAYYIAYQMDKGDSRNAALDSSYFTRNAYALNQALSGDMPLCDPSTGDINRYYKSTSQCGTLYHNKDSVDYDELGWIGTFYPDSETLSFVINGMNRYVLTADALRPDASNQYSLGKADKLWKDIYCATGTINTSDRNQKTDIVDVPNEVLDAWGKVRYKRFLFSDAVEKKGEAARYHIGLIAQDIQEAFSSAGLNAEDYGLFCADTIVDETGQEKTVLGIRYTEALALECAYIRRRLDSSIFY